VKPPPFRYTRAQSPEHAVSLLTEHGEDAKLLAGGQSLVPMLNLRLTRPSVLVDIGRIPSLDELRVRDDGVHVGALTTHRQMERLPSSRLAGLVALREAAGLIGHYPIRVRGTVGGSLAHADSASEWALMALAMDAVLTVRGPAGVRDLPSASFFKGFFTTALEQDEMIVDVRFQHVGAATRLEEHARRRGDFALVAAATSVSLEGASCTSARIALGGVSSTPVRIRAAERLLVGSRIDGPAALDALAREVAYTCSREVSPGSDMHASAAYRRRLTETLVERALRRSLREAAVSPLISA
jgi:carbon-monoxide dehydrogenase medium subunit